jgi:hypothetical protein
MKSVRIVGVLVASAALFGMTCDGGGKTATADSTSAPASMDSIASPTGAGAGEPNLAVGNRGEILLSWLEPADSGFALKLATLEKNAWSAATTIRSGKDFFVNWADFPAVIALDGNRLAAHWMQRSSGKSAYAYGVRVVQSSDGGRTWSAPITPHRDDNASAEHGFVAMWPANGELGLAWLDGRKTHGEGHGETMVVASTLSADGKLGPETVVDARTCDCCQNAVAMAASGPIVAYRNRTNDEIRDIYVTRLENGKWSEGVSVHDDNWKINACPVNGPAIQASGKNVAVAWYTGARDTTRVNVAFSNDGGANFTAPVRVDNGQPGGRVGLVLLPDGSAIVSWLERTGGDTAAVLARRVTPDGQMGGAKTVAVSSSVRASGVPRMIMSGQDIYFAWTVPTKPSSVRVARTTAGFFR